MKGAIVMTLKEEMKRKNDKFWAENENLVLVTTDMIRAALVHSQYARGYTVNKFYIRITRENYYDDLCLFLHVSPDPEFRVIDETTLNTFAAGSEAFADKIMGIIAKKIEKEGFTAITHDDKSGALMAEIDLV